MKTISNTLIAALMAVVLTAFVGLCLQTPFGQGLESWMSDKMQTWRYEISTARSINKPDPRLVLIAVDQRSASDLGRWPFPRSIHGQILQLLAPEKPSTVGWDVFFTEKSTGGVDTTQPTPPAPAPTPAPADGTAPAATAEALPAPAEPSDDAVLVEGVKAFPRLITVAVGDPDGLDLKKEDILPTRPLTKVAGNIGALSSSSHAAIPFTELRKVSYFGFAEADARDYRRLIPLVVNIDGQVFPSFDLQVIMQYLGVDTDHVTVNIGHDITLTKPDGGAVIIPIDAGGKFLVNYRGQTSDFQSVGYSKLGVALDDKANNKITADTPKIPVIKDNIVIFGVTLSGTDNGPTPIDPYSPLVVAHLNVLNNILQADYLHSIPLWVWLPIYALFIYVIANLMLRVGVLSMIGIAAGFVLMFLVAAFLALVVWNVQVPVAMPGIGLLLLAIAVPSKGFFGEEREKRRVKSAMSAHLSEKVMHHILAHPDNLKLGGVKVEITVLFCDIRGFTKYCDNRDSQEVMDVLNDYMEEMTKVVHKYDGTVDKYIGDCIMAFWNAPAPQVDHAQRAVCCAMEMRYALAEFKTKRAGLDIELFECGIGIHTGEALVGNMGSSFKRSYTAMGSTVNMGARLEALTKRLNERILISKDTLEKLTGDFPITDRGEATVAGFATPVHVYAVGADQDITSALKVGRKLATQQDYTADEVTAPIWKPAPLPEDADPNP